MRPTKTYESTEDYPVRFQTWQLFDFGTTGVGDGQMPWGNDNPPRWRVVLGGCFVASFLGVGASLRIVEIGIAEPGAGLAPGTHLWTVDRRAWDDQGITWQYYRDGVFGSSVQMARPYDATQGSTCTFRIPPFVVPPTLTMFVDSGVSLANNVVFGNDNFLYVVEAIKYEDIVPYLTGIANIGAV